MVTDDDGRSGHTVYPPLGDWSLHSRCWQIGLDPDLFFLDPVPKVAKEACEECPVQADCLLYALDNKLRGYWGGTTERERWRIRRANARRRRTVEAVHGDPCPSCRSNHTVWYSKSQRECLDCGARWPTTAGR